MLSVNESARTKKIETGLFDCCSHMDQCCYVVFCTCCAQANMWADIRGEQCDCCYVCCIHAQIFTRANIRHARGAELNWVGDYCVECFCPICSLCQDWAEIELLKGDAQPAP
jgi:Cys-rich protein (TIGR01571 family)